MAEALAILTLAPKGANMTKHYEIETQSDGTHWLCEGKWIAASMSDCTKRTAQDIADALNAAQAIKETDNRPELTREMIFKCAQDADNRGMTLRDYFAAAALQSLHLGKTGMSGRDIAAMAYDMADFMLSEREKP